jgi:hypothetical protein
MFANYSRSFAIAVFIILFFVLLALVLFFVYLLGRIGEPTHIRSVDEHGRPKNVINSFIILYYQIIYDKNKLASNYKGKPTITAGEGDVEWLNIIIKRVLDELVFKNASKIRDVVLEKVDSELKLPDVVVCSFFIFTNT